MREKRFVRTYLTGFLGQFQEESHSSTLSSPFFFSCFLAPDRKLNTAEHTNENLKWKHLFSK